MRMKRVSKEMTEIERSKGVMQDILYEVIEKRYEKLCERSLHELNMLI